MHPWAGIKPSFMGNSKHSLCASWGTIPIYKSPAEAMSKGDSNFSPFFFCSFSFPFSSPPVFLLLFLAILTPPFSGLGWDQAAFLMRAAAPVWALLSMQLHEPRNPPSILPWVVAVSSLKQQKEKQSATAISPGYNWVLLQCRSGTWRSVTHVIVAPTAEPLREVTSDMLPFLPTHTLAVSRQLPSTSRELWTPSEHSIWMWL